MKKFTLSLALLSAVCALPMMAETDVTEQYLVNPGFESGTQNWVCNGMNTQSNVYFTAKKDTYYLESWVSRGQKLGSASALQTIANLPAGKYRLMAAAMFIQQSGAESTVNTGDPQTGAYLMAADYKMPVTDMKDYSLDFVVIDDNSTVKVGYVVENGTGNWAATDDYRLFHIGDIDADAVADYLEVQLKKYDDLLTAPMQSSVRNELETAIADARAALADEARTEQTLRAALTKFAEAAENATASNARYLELDSNIAYAEKVYGWWKDLESKQENCAKLLTAINEAKNKAKDYTLADEDFATAISALNTVVATVDKQIYMSSSAVGTATSLKNPENNWCSQRSLQGKHWILYWEKGYGEGQPANIQTIVDNADKLFECYANELGFLTINEGKSKTDKYKMIIRLKATEEWEASGSGIDDTIGMLNLSRWAYTSRNGQTVAHEVGHCFQYQVHCDNKNQNGWMYTWSGSPNGNVFWEMCAQWQAYKYYPSMQFNGNEWLNNTIKGFFQNPFHEELRYNNFFIQDYMCHKHGLKFIGRLWNESKSPEDPLQAYMRITMEGTTAEKLAQLGDEMWEYGARLTTFDFDHLNEMGKTAIGVRAQTAMKTLDDGYFMVKPEECVENFGNNAIYLKPPKTDTMVACDFVGLTDTTGFRKYNSKFAGWRVGFVAYKKDGTRYYGDVKRFTFDNNTGRVYMNVPGGCDYLWLVVSGAPTKYWCRGWDGNTANDEQWPYRVRFRNTNLLGKKVVEEDFSAVEEIEATTPDYPADVYTITGIKVRNAGESLEGLPHGIYIVAGKKIAL